MVATTSVIAIEPHAVKFHPVIDQAEAQLLGDLALERLEFGIDEFGDLAGLDVDQVMWCASGAAS